MRRFLVCLVWLSSLHAGAAQAALPPSFQAPVTQVAEPVELRVLDPISKDPVIVSGVTLMGARATLGVLASNPLLKDGTVICGPAVALNCGYGSWPKGGPSWWGFRRVGAGVSLTVYSTSVSIRRRSLRIAVSFTF